MRNALLVASALSGLAAALPQNINIAAAKAVPTPSLLGPAPTLPPNAPVNYNQASAVDKAKDDVASGAVKPSNKRDTSSCPAQPVGAAPATGDYSVGAFQNPSNALMAIASAATAPSGYVENFKAKSGATQQIGYLTYKILPGTTYDVGACAAFCDSEKFCLGFNIYYERDGTVQPTSDCPNPAPQTNIKCSLFGYPVSAATATNSGQWQEQFQVVITGSNGYSKSSCTQPPTLSGYSVQSLPAAVNAPDVSTYNGMRLFNTNPFDPSLCAAACEAQTAFDKEHLVSNGRYTPCNYFTSYILTDNGVPLGTYCALYSVPIDSQYAVNSGYTSGSDTFNVVCTAAYTATTQDSGIVSQ
ncbi:hypothetical protein ACJQWK_01251 [Exserohilum turcicum]